MKSLRGLFSYYSLVVVASIIPLVLFGFFTYQNEKESYERQTIQNLQEINKNKVASIYKYFDQIKFEIHELGSTIDFLQVQANKNIDNLQALQEKSILSYFSYIKKTIISLSKKDTFQYAYSFLNRGKTVAPQYLDAIVEFKNDLGIKNLYFINPQGKIVFARDLKIFEGRHIQDVNRNFLKNWSKILHLREKEDAVYFINFAYNKITKKYHSFIIAPFHDVNGFIAFEIDQKPIEKILHNVSSLGDSAESYLVYRENKNTFLASNRIRKSGTIGDEKSNIYVDKGFNEKGISLKYGSLGDVELVGYRPIQYKNLHLSMQTTVRYTDIISPTIDGMNYFEKFIKDYHYHNLMLISSKGEVIYSIKHKYNYKQSVFRFLSDQLLANTVKQALAKKDFVLSDMGLYPRCKEEIGEFGVDTILNDKYKNIDIIVALQLHALALSEVIAKTSVRFYKTLDNYVIGQDGRLRTVMQLQKDRFKVFDTLNETQDHTMQNMKIFFQTGKKFFYSKDYRGKETLSVYSKVDYGNIHWVVVSKVDLSELDMMTYAIKKEVIVFSVMFSILAILIMIMVSYYKRKQDKKVLYSAMHDPLTKLPNRRYIFEFLEYILSANKRTKLNGAVLFMDLDNFKFINDSYGHEAGDFVLVETSSRLRNLLRQNDVLARLGGDEFLVVVEYFHHIGEIDTLCKRIIDVVAQPIYDGKQTYQVGVSIGIATFPNDSNNPKELLQFADTAMYQTKDTGKNGFTYYSEEMTQKSLNAARVESELQRAIQNDELVLYYQPQIDIQTNRVVGVEALVRWQHPKEGLIMPNNFIPIAEESHLIIELGEWVAYNSCVAFKSWKDSGYALDYIAVNLSSKQLVCDKCSANIKTMLDTLNFPSQWLELEITENTLIENFDRVIKNITMFKELGIKFSIDDFGTGYSSLSYLKSLQISTLKIDREFVKDIVVDKDDYAIVKAVISMGHSLGYKIIAEGAEHKEEIDVLRDLGCDVVQGYYFSKPLTEVELLEFMDRCEQGGGR